MGSGNGCGCGDVGGVRFEASDAGCCFVSKCVGFLFGRVVPSKRRRVIGGCLPSLGVWMSVRGGICLKTVRAGRSKWCGEQLLELQGRLGGGKHDHGAAGMGVVDLRLVFIGCLVPRGLRSKADRVTVAWW